MKKLTVAIITSALVASVNVSAFAQTARVCTSVYGGGEVCGETTTTVNTNVTHETVDAGFSKEQMQNMAVAMMISGAVALVAYRLTYRWYNK